MTETARELLDGVLILTRKIDQSIVIDSNITVVVLGIERDRVKIGIIAPKDIEILREELLANGGAWKHGSGDQKKAKT